MNDYLVLSWEYLVPFLLSWVYLGEGGTIYIHRHTIHVTV